MSSLLALMLLASTAEVVSIGAVVPFLGALTFPEKLLAHPFAASLLPKLGIVDARQLQISLTLMFISGALLSGVMRTALSWMSIRLAYSLGADLSFEIYRRTLYQPYSVHVSRNSSQVIAAVVTKVNSVINGFITPVMTLSSSALMMTAIAIVLFVINPMATIFSMLGFGAIYLVIIWTTRRIKRQNGRMIAAEATNVVKALQEGLGGIRDILLDGSQRVHCAAYHNADAPLRRAQASNQFLAASPRFAIEAIGMSLIAAIALLLSHQLGGIESSIPVLGALAIGAQRLLPIMQQGYAAWSSMVSNLPILEEALELLEQPAPLDEEHEADDNMLFGTEIRFSRVVFRYGPDQRPIFDGLDAVIEKGGLIGVIGRTGSGKSTFVDILMGLLTPTGGYIEVDGVRIDENNRRAWQRRIAHVPQSIFLSDGSIAENIAFGIPKAQIDFDRVMISAAKAQIATDVEALPLGYDTRVGERGVRLSGGQRQRIGIARALYKKADVIVFDEATSALDSETESAVMTAIQSLGKDITVIIIAHRTSTLARCSKIIEMVVGGIVRIRTFEDLSRMQYTKKKEAANPC
ncbi:MAG: ABC transporter ATP-binding protein [Burkholderiaceae bacterium]